MLSQRDYVRRMRKYVSDFEIWRLGEVPLLIALTQSLKMKAGPLSKAKTAVTSLSRI